MDSFVIIVVFIIVVLVLSWNQVNHVNEVREMRDYWRQKYLDEVKDTQMYRRLLLRARDPRPFCFECNTFIKGDFDSDCQKCQRPTHLRLIN